MSELTFPYRIPPGLRESRSKDFIGRLGFIVGRMGAGRLDFGQVEATVPESEGDIPILIGRNPLFRYFEVIFKEYRDNPAYTLVQKKPLPASNGKALSSEAANQDNRGTPPR